VKTRVRWAAVALGTTVVVLATGACATEGGAVVTEGSPHRAVALSAKDNGQGIQLLPGEELIVTLESNASTGFRWLLVEKPDPNVLKLLGSDYVAASTDLLGAPGQEIWTFQGVGSGRTTLELRYQRASGEAAGQAFRLSIEVVQGS
jgi:inhibitor of cysteine peptidase